MKSPQAPADAVDFHSEIATDFSASYKADANRLERVRVWNGLLDQYAGGAKFAYDIGCGPGVLSREVAGRGIEVFAIDGAAGMLAVSKKAAADAGLINIQFQQSRLPIADTSGYRPADLVLSSSVIEYLDSIPEALRFLKALSRPGATIIFSVSNKDSLSRRLVRLVHGLTGRPRYFGLLKHFMNIQEIQADLRTVGLEYVEHRYFGGADRMNSVLGAVLPKRFASNMIVVVARRPA